MPLFYLNPNPQMPRDGVYPCRVRLRNSRRIWGRVPQVEHLLLDSQGKGPINSAVDSRRDSPIRLREPQSMPWHLRVFPRILHSSHFVSKDWTVYSVLAIQYAITLGEGDNMAHRVGLISDGACGAANGNPGPSACCGAGTARPKPALTLTRCRRSQKAPRSPLCQFLVRFSRKDDIGTQPSRRSCCSPATVPFRLR